MCRLPILIIILFVAFLYHTAASDPASFWSLYPSCAVNNCLVPLSAASSCELNDNLCVCTNATFISSIAVCLGEKCPDLGDRVYDQYKSACSYNGGYTFALNKTQFLAESKTLNKVLLSFWAGYPECALNSCLVPLTANSGCEIDDNGCVCTNETFVSAVAHCTGQKCPNTVADVYSQFSFNCFNNGGYTLALSESRWYEESNGPLVSTGSQTSLEPSQTSQTSLEPSQTSQTSLEPSQTSQKSELTTTQMVDSFSPTLISSSTLQPSQPPLSSPSPSPPPSPHGLTMDQKIALGLGLGVGLPTFLVGIIHLFKP